MKLQSTTFGDIKAAVIDGLAPGLSVIPVGLGYGIVAHSFGLSLGQTVLFSGIVCAGAAQTHQVELHLAEIEKRECDDDRNRDGQTHDDWTPDVPQEEKQHEESQARPNDQRLQQTAKKMLLRNSWLKACRP